jgi:Flp pilus assembly protein TadG
VQAVGEGGRAVEPLMSGRAAADSEQGMQVTRVMQVVRVMRHLVGGRQDGQAIVEFALSVPILALVLFALIEFGLMMNNQVAIVNASRDGARVAALLSGDPAQTTNVQTAVTQAWQPTINCALTAGSPAITSTTNALGGTQTASWTVLVGCTYTAFTPLGSLLNLFSGSHGASPCSGGGYTICASTTMRDPSCNRPSCTP